MLVMYQQLFLPLCQILCQFVYYSFSKTLALRQKKDVFNTHGIECTAPEHRNIFLKIMIYLLGH